MDEYDATAELQSIRENLGLAEGSAAAEVMASLWARINARAVLPSLSLSARVERGARALCRHLGVDPEQTVSRRDPDNHESASHPAWMDHVAAVKAVLDAADPSPEHTGGTTIKAEG